MSAFSDSRARRSGGALCLLLLLLLLQQQQTAPVAAAAVESAASAAAEPEELPAPAAAAEAAAAAADESVPLTSPEERAAAADGEAEKDGAAKGKWPYVSWVWNDNRASPEEVEDTGLFPFGFGISFKRATSEELQRMHERPLVKRVSRGEGIKLALWALLMYVVAQGLRYRRVPHSDLAVDLMEKGAGILALLGALHVAFFSLVKMGFNKTPATSSYPGETKKEALVRRAGFVLRVLAVGFAALLAVAFAAIFITLVGMLLGGGAAKAGGLLAEGLAETGERQSGDRGDSGAQASKQSQIKDEQPDQDLIESLGPLRATVGPLYHPDPRMWHASGGAPPSLPPIDKGPLPPHNTPEAERQVEAPVPSDQGGRRPSFTGGPPSRRAPFRGAPHSGGPLNGGPSLKPFRRGPPKTALLQTSRGPRDAWEAHGASWGTLSKGGPLIHRLKSLYRESAAAAAAAAAVAAAGAQLSLADAAAAAAAAASAAAAHRFCERHLWHLWDWKSRQLESIFHPKAASAQASLASHAAAHQQQQLTSSSSPPAAAAHQQQQQQQQQIANNHNSSSSTPAAAAAKEICLFLFLFLSTTTAAAAAAAEAEAAAAAAAASEGALGNTESVVAQPADGFNAIQDEEAVVSLAGRGAEAGGAPPASVELEGPPLQEGAPLVRDYTDTPADAEVVKQLKPPKMSWRGFKTLLIGTAVLLYLSFSRKLTDTKPSEAQLLLSGTALAGGMAFVIIGLMELAYSMG
ncbi:hypothetical protein Emed_004644 [Eimeria media]